MDSITFTDKELEKIVTKVVKETLVRYFEPECNSEQLKKAIADRVDYLLDNGNLPTRVIFDYYETIYGDPNYEDRNDYFIKNVIEAFKRDNLSQMHYTDVEYTFYKNFVVNILANIIRKLLFNLNYSDDIDVQLVAIPEDTEGQHRLTWQSPLTQLGKEVNLTSHICSYVYSSDREDPQHNPGLPKGHFESFFFRNEENPNSIPHIILICRYISKKNYKRIHETAEMLRGMGYQVLALIALGKVVEE